MGSLEIPTTSTPTPTPIPAIFSRNIDHQALNQTWRTYFAQHPTHDATPPINDNNLLPTANVPWGRTRAS